MATSSCPRSITARAEKAAKALAKYRDADGAPIPVQQRAYDAYSKALRCVADSLGVPALSDELSMQISARAERYRKVVRGPGSAF